MYLVLSIMYLLLSSKYDEPSRESMDFKISLPRCNLSWPESGHIPLNLSRAKNFILTNFLITNPTLGIDEAKETLWSSAYQIS